MTDNAEDKPLGHVLVVDDNEMNREVLSRRLERLGCTYEVAVDGITALELMRQQHFDLVMLDIMMPRMNGYQLLETMKTDPALRHIPAIVVSAISELESIVRCVELGATDYLFKPFNPVLLKARLTAILEKNRLTAASRATTAATKSAAERALNIIKQNTAILLDPSNGTLTPDQQQLVYHIDHTVSDLIEWLAAVTP